MGCINCSQELTIQSLASNINSMIQTKSILQYQISQLKIQEERKKSVPDILDVKEAQIQNIKLAKEVKDTKNLLFSIKGGDSHDESILALSEIFYSLKKKIEDKENEAKNLQDELVSEANVLENFQKNLNSLIIENESLQDELNTFTKSEKFKIIEKYCSLP